MRTNCSAGSNLTRHSGAKSSDSDARESAAFSFREPMTCRTMTAENPFKKVQNLTRYQDVLRKYQRVPSVFLWFKSLFYSP